MRKGTLIAAGGAVLLLAAAAGQWRPDKPALPDVPAVTVRPPAPTAEEEAGRTSMHAQPPLPLPPGVRTRPAPPQRTTSVRRTDPAGESRREQAAGPDDERTADREKTVAQPGPDAPAAEDAPRARSVDDQPSPTPEQPPVPAEVPAPPPVLQAPVLLSPKAAYPGDGYEIVLDRSSLTPELRLRVSEGRVVLRVLVRADGTVGAVEIASSSGHPAFDRVAVQAATSWRFQPATRDGEPITAWAVIPVSFVAP